MVPANEGRFQRLKVVECHPDALCIRVDDVGIGQDVSLLVDDDATALATGGPLGSVFISRLPNVQTHDRVHQFVQA